MLWPIIRNSSVHVPPSLAATCQLRSVSRKVERNAFSLLGYDRQEKGRQLGKGYPPRRPSWVHTLTPDAAVDNLSTATCSSIRQEPIPFRSALKTDIRPTAIKIEWINYIWPIADFHRSIDVRIPHRNKTSHFALFVSFSHDL
jgi:hypothetical protein